MKRFFKKNFLLVIMISIILPSLLSIIPVMKVYATSNVIDEINITSMTTSVPVGVLPDFTVETTTEHISIQEMGSNTIWAKNENGYTWGGFGVEIPTAVVGDTHYGLRLCIELDDGYSFDDEVTIYFNGEDITEVGYTYLDTGFSWGAYLYIDLGQADSSIHTITFDTDGGSAIASQLVSDGDTVSRPEVDPQKDGYTFIGWYEDDTLTTPFDFETPVINNATIYAKWILNVTVTIDVNGGNEINPNTFTGLKGQTIMDILADVEQPTHSDPYKVIEGIYDARENGNELDLNMVVNSDITIYIYWADVTPIEEINLTLEAPVIGEEVELVYDNEEDEYVPSITPQFEKDSEDYGVYNPTWVMGNCKNDSNACNQLFEGTFEEDTYYYAIINLFSVDNYIFTLDTLDHITINGEEPEEIFNLYNDNTETMVIAKIMAVEPTPGEEDYSDLAEIEIGGGAISISGANGEENSVTITYPNDNRVVVTGNNLYSRVNNDRFFVYGLGDITVTAIAGAGYDANLIENGNLLNTTEKTYIDLRQGDMKRIDGEFTEDCSYEVDFETATWNINDAVVNAEVSGKVLNQGEVSLYANEEITLTNFNAGTMQVRIYSEGGFNAVLSVIDGKTTISSFDGGNLPNNETLTFVVEAYDNQDEMGLGGDEDISFGIDFTGTHVNVWINDIVVITDENGFTNTFDGVITESGTTDPNETNTLRFVVSFGDKDIKKYIINGVEYQEGDSAVTIDNEQWLIEVPGAEKYTITGEIDEESVVARTIIWANTDANQNSDEYDEDMILEHGSAKIIGIYSGSDKVSGENDVDSDGFGYAVVNPGDEVVFEFVPEYGYQLIGVSVNGMALEAQDNLNQYSFIMPDANVHFAAQFARVEDIVKADSEKVASGSITLSDALEGGSVELTVKDIQLSSDKIKDFESAAGEYTISSYLDIDLYNVFYKGKNDSTDVWSNKIDTLSDYATITIKLEDGINADDIVLVHNIHDGEQYEIIEIDSYDKQTNTITFKTKSFSNYAIATRTSSTVTSPQTSDSIYKWVTMLVISMIGLLYGVLKFRKISVK